MNKQTKKQMCLMVIHNHTLIKIKSKIQATNVVNCTLKISELWILSRILEVISQSLSTRYFQYKPRDNVLKSSSSVHEADNSRFSAGQTLCIPLISLYFSSSGCFRWFLIPFSLGSGRQVKRPSAFQGWLPITPQLSEGMGTFAALVCSRILVPLIDFQS